MEHACCLLGCCFGAVRALLWCTFSSAWGLLCVLLGCCFGTASELLICPQAIRASNRRGGD
eukprot:5534692-Lingulodinium_polyedra.AAC.1